MNKQAILLFVSAGCFFTLFHPGHPLTVDGATTLQTVRALARGELHIPEMLVTRVGREGRHYSLYGPLLPVLSLPGYLIGSLFDDPLPPPGSREVGWGDWAALGVNAWVSAGILVYLFLLGEHCRLRKETNLLLAFGCGLSTMILPYARDFFSQPLCAFLLTGAGYWMIRHRDEPRTVYLTAASLHIALLPWARMDLGLAFAALFLWIVFRPSPETGPIPNRRKELRIALIPILGSMLLLFLFDWYRWGSWGGAPYGDQRFDTPLMDSLPKFIFSPELSIFLYNPLLILSVVLLLLHWESLKWFAGPVLLVDLMYLIVVGKYGDYHGGVCPGPRYFLSLVPINLFPLFLVGPHRRIPTLPFVLSMGVAFGVGLVLNVYAALVDYTTSPPAWDYWMSKLF